MKAILEIEMPESCFACRLVTLCFWATIPDFREGARSIRHPDCPLKVAPSCADANKRSDGTCEGYQKSDIDDDPAEMCMECKQNIFYEGGQ